MKKLVFKAPLNSLSFGNVSMSLLREMFNKGMEVSFFPTGNVDIQAFGNQDEEFKSWLENSINNRFSRLDRETPTLQLWHLNGAENRITENQTLFTFYELDSPTEAELSIAKLQNKLILSSQYATDSFRDVGVRHATACPLGFDASFHKTDKDYLSGKIHFGLMGKFEKRKHTKKIIQAWIKKYGNNYNYQLTCCITNPFYKREDMERVIMDIAEGQRYGNINFLPYLPSNEQVNDYLNSIDVDLGGVSGAEGWNLPSFNSSCLGKWSIVLNASAHKDWANKENCILLEPNGKEPVYDNVFFKEGAPFNQGNIYTFDEDEFIDAMEKSENVCKTENKEGLKLAKEFTYEKTLDKILSAMAA